MKKTAMALAALMLTAGLTGCAGMNAPVDGEAQTAEGVRPEICLIPNPNVKSPELDAAIAEGVKHVGYDVKIVPEGSKLDVCDHCFAYALKLNKKGDAVEAVLFQTFVKGQPELGAAGPADEKGQLTLQQIAEYAAVFANQVMTKSKTETESNAQPAADAQ